MELLPTGGGILQLPPLLAKVITLSPIYMVKCAVAPTHAHVQKAFTVFLFLISVF